MSMFLRRIMLSIGGLIKKIVSSVTEVVSFVTNVAMPTKITCQFSPVQDGTGDPSPDNVHPISGWAGCKIGRNGNNFLKVASGSLDTGGIVVTSDGENITVTGTPTSTYGFIFISGDQLQYATSVANAQSLAATFSDTVLPVGRFALTQIVVQEEQDTGRPTQLYIFYKSGSYVNIATGASPSSASLTENAVAYALRVQKSTTYNGTWKHALGLGSERPEYETYNGDMLSVNWAEYEISLTQSGTGTPSPSNVRPITAGLSITRDDSTTLEVYGGKLTLNVDGTSTLLSTKFKFVCSGGLVANPSASYINSTSFYVNVNNSTGYELDGNNYIPEAISDTLPVYNGALWNKTRTEIAFCRRNASNTQIGLRLPFSLVGATYDVDTMAELGAKTEAYLLANPITFVLPYATPQTYTLSATETQRALTALGESSKIAYGGSYTINEDGSADMVIEWARYDYLSDSYITQQSSNPIQTINEVEYGVAYVYTGIASNRLGFGELANITDIWFNKLAVFRTNTSITTDYAVVPSASDTSSYIHYYIKTSELDDISTAAKTRDSIRAWLYENQVYFVAKLRTPVTYHFDNIGQLNSFIGANSIWHDMNGAITVEYYKKQ